MRHRAAAALAAATILLLPATATGHTHHRPKRVGSHISLHLSRHDLLSGHTLVATGRFAPGGPHRVKIVLRGRLGAVARTTTNGHGRFRLPLGTSRTGIYTVRAYGVHGR